MEKNKHRRSVKTSFWEDKWVEGLSSDERLLFLYFLTSPASNIAGVYQETIKRISFNSGLSEQKVKKILGSFEEERKVLYLEGYVCVTNFIKNQALNDNMKKGVETILSGLPETVRKAFESFQTLSVSVVKVESKKVESKKVENTPKKIKYGDYVEMKETEYLKLVAQFGERLIKEKIDAMDTYVISKGLQRQYKDHYRTILGWAKKDSLIITDEPHDW